MAWRLSIVRRESTCGLNDVNLPDEHPLVESKNLNHVSHRRVGGQPNPVMQDHDVADLDDVLNFATNMRIKYEMATAIFPQRPAPGYADGPLVNLNYHVFGARRDI